MLCSDSLFLVFQVEEDNERLERTNNDLSKKVATLELTVDKYEEIEQQLSDREVSVKGSMLNRRLIVEISVCARSDNS